MVRLYIPILLIAFCAISNIYLIRRFIPSDSICKWLIWIPLAVVCGFFVNFLCFNEGMDKEVGETLLFLLVMLVVCVPTMLFTLFSLIPKVGIYIGAAVSVCILGMIAWGATVGFTDVKVREVEYTSEDVPEAFDGYRIAVFSDMHVGTFRGPYYHLVQESMDSINALKPDMICFLGDIENFVPGELVMHQKAFSSLHAPDGIFSIMGNHDFTSYLDLTPKQRADSVAETRRMQKTFGWHLMENEHVFIKRGNDSIVIVGEENWGKPPFPQLGDIHKAIKGLPYKKSGKTTPFTVMLSHDPNAWRMHILPVFRPQITLSGHTHGTQFSIFGWCPSSLIYNEWGGTYWDKECMLDVSTGLGGNFPYRFNMTREIVLVTLHHGSKKAN